MIKIWLLEQTLHPEQILKQLLLLGQQIYPVLPDRKIPQDLHVLEVLPWSGFISLINYCGWAEHE